MISDSDDEDDGYSRLAPAIQSPSNEQAGGSKQYLQIPKQTTSKENSSQSDTKPTSSSAAYMEITENTTMAQPDARGVVRPPKQFLPNASREKSFSNVNNDHVSDGHVTANEANLRVMLEAEEDPTYSEPKIDVKTKRTLRRSSSGGIYDSVIEVTRHDRYALYVLLSRCIALPFNAEKQTSLSDKMQHTLTPVQFEHIRSRVTNFLRGDLNGIRSVDKTLADLIENFFDKYMRLYSVQKCVKSGAMTMAELKDVFALNVSRQVENMGFRDVSSADQLKNKWNSFFHLIIEGDRSQKASDVSALSYNKEKMMLELRLVLKIRTQIHNKLATLMQLNKQPKLISLVKAELRERKQCEHDPEMFKMPVNWANEDMEYDVVRELSRQTDDLMKNLESVEASQNDHMADESHGELKRYLSRMNYKIRKSKTWMEERASYFGSPDADFAMGAVIPVFTVTVKIEHMRDVAVNFTRSKCMSIAHLKSARGKDNTRRLNLEPTHDPSYLEGVNEEATFSFGGPRPLLEVSFCTFRKEGPIGKSLAATHKLAIAQFQIYPDRIEANPDFPEYKLVYQLGAKRDVKMMPLKKTFPPLTCSLSISFGIPENVKCTGELFISSKEMTNKTWKRRYVILLEASRANFVLSCYKDNSGQPTDVLPLDGFTVDYLSYEDEAMDDVVEYPKIKDLPEGTLSSQLFYFSAKRGKLKVELGALTSDGRDLWLDKLSSATRQTFKPEPPMDLDNSANDEAIINMEEIEMYSRLSYLSPSDEVDTHRLFTILLEILLDHKIKDPYRSMGWYTAGQELMIDEFCMRYGIRCTEKYLQYLKILLRRALEGSPIDPSLLHLAFVCTSASFREIKLPAMTSNVNPLLGLFTQDEYDCFYPEEQLPVDKLLNGDFQQITSDFKAAIEENLLETLVGYLLSKISNFTTMFPFGKPSGVLESCIAFLERIMNETNPFENSRKDPYAHVVANRVTSRSLAEIIEMSHANGNSITAQKQKQLKNKATTGKLSSAEGQGSGKNQSDREGMMTHIVLLMVETCLTKAAAADFNHLCSYNSISDDTAAKSVTESIEEFKRFFGRIAEHLQTVETFFVESFKSFPGQLNLYLETVVCMFYSRFNSFMQTMPLDCWHLFSVYQQINTFFMQSRLLCRGRFHRQLCDLFGPVVIRYMDTTESSIAHSYTKNIQTEKWISQGSSTHSSEDVFWKVRALKNFIDDLKWPNEEFSQHLSFRMMFLASNVIDAVVKDAAKAFHQKLNAIPKTRAALLTPDLCVTINVLTRSDDIITSLRLQKFLAKTMKSQPVDTNKNWKTLKFSELLVDQLEAIRIALSSLFDTALTDQLNELAKYDNKTTFIYTLYSFGVNLKTKVVKSVSRQTDAEREAENQSLIETAPTWLIKWLTSSSGAQTDEFDLSGPYIDFLRNNLAVMREHIKCDELVEIVMEDLFESIVGTVLDWINRRLHVQLDIVQLNSINSLIKKSYRAFLMENLKVERLETDSLKLLRSRLEAEERGASKLGKGNLVTEGVADSDEEDEIGT
ncbi:calcium-dependent secretion activator 1-like isoform X2 [Symsagittifera roscoffensis]|uniref:calcium-dependent secretion activator 1-like isoform X2 n=1 Tax=Symsagittifera roscoffensis TaxID=84072 RepID=UPI00307BF228